MLSVTAGPFQQWMDQHQAALVGVPARILLIVAVAVALRLVAGKLIIRAVTRLTQRRTKRRVGHGEAATQSERIAAERRHQRAQTIGAVLTSTASVVIGVVAVMLVLGEFGINLGPIIASVGIIGLAVGFGAQSLVSDVVAGVFMLAEDQYGVGDWVDVYGYASGTIEHVGLRTTQLRDSNGALWFVRNGQIVCVGNHAQDWARALLDIPVAYDQNIERASQLLLDTARELANDPDWSHAIIDDPEVWGVSSLTREAVTVQLAVTTAPQQQWSVARELRHRIKAAFDEHGARIPYTQQAIIHTNGAANGTGATLGE